MDAYTDTLTNQQGKFVEPPLSIAALKANLFYADAQKQKAFNAHKDALISYHLALDALNQAIVKKNNQG